MTDFQDIEKQILSKVRLEKKSYKNSKKTLKTIYKPEYCDKILQIAEDVETFTLNQAFCAQLAITERQMHEWCNEYQDFNLAYNRAQNIWEEKMAKVCILNKLNPKYFTIFMKRQRGIDLEVQQIEHSINSPRVLQQLLNEEEEVYELDDN